jgi:hypothetical protein
LYQVIETSTFTMIQTSITVTPYVQIVLAKTLPSDSKKVLGFARNFSSGVTDYLGNRATNTARESESGTIPQYDDEAF